MNVPFVFRGLRAPGPVLLIALALMAGPSGLRAQDGSVTRERLLEVGREIIDRVRYVTLATIGDDGSPRLRIMDPAPPDANMIVWMATNPRTRKVEEIRRNPAVSLHWFDADQLGYVTLKGTARLVTDPEEKRRRWQDAWAPFYPDRGDAYMLIEVTPEWMEVVSVERGIVGPDDTWLPPRVVFERPGD